MTDLYTWTTPNGRKVSILLEELGLPYAANAVDIGRDQQFAPDFLKLSPNNKIPAIVDRETDLALMESGAILIYLADRHGRFLARDGEERHRTIEWLMWQMAGFGPMIGQTHHFLRVAKGRAPYAEERFTDEVARLYSVLDQRLEGSAYVVGDYSIADIAIWPWVARFEWHAVDLNAYPNVRRWYQTIAKRPAVIRGYDVPLVTTQWLADHLGDPDLLVFDTTKYLPNEPGDVHADYRASHIPGARYWNSDLVSDPDSDLPSTVPSASRFAAAAGNLGIGPGVRVVFYDRKGLSTAARAWWLLGLFGFDDAAVLDGGLPKWLAEGRSVDDREPLPPAPRNFTPALRAARLRGTGDLLVNLDSGAEHVLDARAAARFAGLGAEPRPGLSSGHVPGSRSLPYTTLLEKNATFPPADILRQRFAEAGIDGIRPVVTTCGSGVSAAILSLGLTLAGLPIGTQYDGSWTEWGSRTDTPVERDDSGR